MTPDSPGEAVPAPAQIDERAIVGMALHIKRLFKRGQLGAAAIETHGPECYRFTEADCDAVISRMTDDAPDSPAPVPSEQQHDEKDQARVDELPYPAAPGSTAATD